MSLIKKYSKCPLPFWGKLFFKPSWYYFLSPIFKKFLRVKIINKENLYVDEPILIAVNHRSYIDPPLIASIMPQPVVFLAKKELFKGFLGSWFFRNLNAVPVDRSKADLKALNIAIEKLKQACWVCIFPEGKRAKKGEFLRPKPGIGYIVAKTNVKVLPIYLHNTDRILSKDTSLIKFPLKPIYVVVGKPIEFPEVEDNIKGYKLIANTVMEKIKELYFQNRDLLED
jgi:1-acyl-sn-glycerol-3-phosphate acyltransferase